MPSWANESIIENFKVNFSKKIEILLKLNLIIF